MNTPATDAQADFLLDEVNKRIELERIANGTRFDYYYPDGAKAWIATSLSLALMIYIGLVAERNEYEFFVLGLLITSIVFKEISRVEMKIDASNKLSKMEKVDQ